MLFSPERVNAYSSARFILVFEDVENALIVIFFALHGL